VTTTADSERQVLLARELDGRHDIRRARGSNDNVGAAIDHAIPDVSCHFEPIVTGSEHLTSHTERQGLNVLFNSHKPSGMESVEHRHETHPFETHRDCHNSSASSSRSRPTTCHLPFRVDAGSGRREN
jgi:hypothetical protein